ncbi:MAG: tripartite tricarboxylate transporter substrate binding protein [Proteobacteria bacterium]|nr:tripartite tricarboxylate transporter substrate binding protein [Burkholderiales bacterium]
MTSLRRIAARLATGALMPGLLAAATFAQAQEAARYPDRQLRMVVPFAAGGPTDIIARLVAAKMGESMGRAVVVENRGGAGGTIGAAEAARLPADGYTLMFHNVSTAAIAPFVYRKLTYDTVRDFTPISRLADVPNVLIINRDVPVKNLKEFIAFTRANPNRINYGSSGIGTVLHLSAELFKQLTSTEGTHVAYKGSAPATAELMAGTLTFLFDNLPGQIEGIRAGTVRALGVTTGTRVSVLPDVPTLAEAGLPAFRNASWFALFVRSGTPHEISRRLEAEAIKAVQDPTVAQRIRDLGAIPIASSAEDLGRFWRAELDLWRPLVERLNLSLD